MTIWDIGFHMMPRDSLAQEWFILLMVKGDSLDPLYHFNGFCVLKFKINIFRLFSCGTNKEGVTNIVEWNESEGYVLRTYLGLSKCSSGVVQFGISKNRFLAAGDEHLIKVWDIDNVEYLATIDADGELVVSALSGIFFTFPPFKNAKLDLPPVFIIV